MSTPETLRRHDFAILVLFAAVLFSFPVFFPKTLTTHETVHCQNIREMRADGDWVIPHYGGRPWLERPPLPFWFTLGLVELLGDSPVVFRLASLLVGLPIVLLVGWMASVWYGRGIGVTSGLILATMQEFNHYATGPEADIFLCLIVTSALALFVHLEFQRRPKGDGESLGLIGPRPWVLVLFFAVWGLTNLVKGLFFGSIFVGLPIATFLLWNWDWSAIRRYVWLPGWLAYLATASLWATAAYWRYPDIVELWLHDYKGRVNQGYMHEPIWYYLAHLPVVLFPWTITALVGLAATRRTAWTTPRAPERFLWCWAIVPVVFFSIPQGKHHHYLLQCMAPWSVLAAVGAARVWQQLARWPALLQKPWLAALLLGGLADVALFAFGAEIPGPSWLLPVLLVAAPLAILTLWIAFFHRDSRVALGTLCGLLLVLHWSVYAYRASCLDRYRHDRDFVQQACAVTPWDRPLLVMDDDAPLNASWLLFYIGDRATLLHNLTFLLDDSIREREVYLIARRKAEPALKKMGDCELLLQSERSRYETTLADRYTLFRFRYRDDAARVPGGVYISPMQATGRDLGPFLH
ncbi:MAG: hypothetical protein JNM56_25050 [Planctomycetia bacterium]|nr:hypothetical protein [Planctomycetia bacterium]